MANVIIKSDERRHQEAAILSQFGGGCERNSDRENREYDQNFHARIKQVKRDVRIR